MGADQSSARVRTAAQQLRSNLDPKAIEEELRRFLDLILRETHLQLGYGIADLKSSESEEGPGILINFDGADRELLLEDQAELLCALEYMAHRWLRLEPSVYHRVRFDCGDFRALRLEELKLSARVAAQRVRETGQTFRFNPMPASERRIIHLELNAAPDVRSSSEGAGMRRHVVIHPVQSK